MLPHSPCLKGMIMTVAHRIFMLLTVAVAAPGAAEAQRHEGNAHGEEQYDDDAHRRSRWEFGLNAATAVLLGDFAANAKDTTGNFEIAFNAAMGLNQSNSVRLRFEFGYVNYGSEKIEVRVFKETDRFSSRLTTRNNIFFVGIGPQIDFSTGPIRPYVNGFLGVSEFYTNTQLSMGGQVLVGSKSWSQGSATNNFKDWVVSYGIGGGVKFRVRKYRGVPIFISIDTQYRTHGQTEYLIEGSIVDDENGNTTIQPLVSDADFFLIGVGVGVGLF